MSENKITEEQLKNLNTRTTINKNHIDGGGDNALSLIHI